MSAVSGKSKICVNQLLSQPTAVITLIFQTDLCCWKEVNKKMYDYEQTWVSRVGQSSWITLWSQEAPHRFLPFCLIILVLTQSWKVLANHHWSECVTAAHWSIERAYPSHLPNVSISPQLHLFTYTMIISRCISDMLQLWLICNGPHWLLKLHGLLTSSFSTEYQWRWTHFPDQHKR